jgi:hypothetical protein
VDVRTGGRHGQEMRFVGHQQIGILVQHRFLERDCRLIGDFAVVVDLAPDLIRGLRGQRLPFS